MPVYRFDDRTPRIADSAYVAPSAVVIGDVEIGERKLPLELPEMGASLDAGDEAGVVESVKAASDIYAPVGGEVIETNERLEEEPEVINADPYNDGWFFRLQPGAILCQVIGDPVIDRLEGLAPAARGPGLRRALGGLENSKDGTPMGR